MLIKKEEVDWIQAIKDGHVLCGLCKKIFEEKQDHDCIDYSRSQNHVKKEDVSWCGFMGSLKVICHICGQSFEEKQDHDCITPLLSANSKVPDFLCRKCGAFKKLNGVEHECIPIKDQVNLATTKKNEIEKKIIALLTEVELDHPGWAIERVKFELIEIERMMFEKILTSKWDVIHGKPVGGIIIDGKKELKY